MKIVVLSPREEHWDGTGGAISTWVQKVQVASDRNMTVLGMSPSNEKTWYRSPHRLQILGLSINRSAVILNKIFSIPVKRIERIMWLRGFLYVLALLPEILKADVLYIHNRPQHAKFARWLGFRGKVIVHMHNDTEPYFRGISDRAIARMDLFVFCSDYIRRGAIEKCRVPVSRTEVLYNGVDDSVVPSPGPMGLDLLFVGRLQEIKGPDVAIETVALLRSKGYESTLTLIGGTDLGLHTSETPYFSALKQQAQSINSIYGPGTVRFLGPQPLTTVLSHMENFPIFIFPSRCNEAFGMVLAESISRGAFPLAPARGGMKEVLNIAGLKPLEGRMTGETFAEAVIDVNESVTVEQRKLAAQRVLSNLNWAKIRKDYELMLSKPTLTRQYD